MEDFVEATSVERQDDGTWHAEISEDWSLWGPSGGYLSALAMRAVGEATTFSRPISFACQFLNRAKFAQASLSVQSLKAGKRTEALRVDLTQDGQLIFTAQVWVGSDTASGMTHDYTDVAQLPDPEKLQSYAEVYPNEPIHPFMRRLGQRPIDPLPHTAEAPTSEPEVASFNRFEPRAKHDDPYVDAARIFILIDTAAWLATYPAHPTADASPWIAPNLDFYYRFHRTSTDDEWLYLKTRADLAESGLISAEGEVRGGKGQLIARGASQLICYPRPSKF